MIEDRNRDKRLANEMNSTMPPEDGARAVGPENSRRGMGLGLWLSILAVLAVSGFYFFGMDRNSPVATKDIPAAATAPSTTGSGTNAPAPAARDGLQNSTDIPGATAPTAPAPKPQ